MSGKSKTIRWGIIGCGDVTEVKSGPPYQQIEGFALEAVMRRNQDKVKDYAHRHQIQKWYTNADKLINDPDIDAVYIATPPDSHLFYGIKVAQAGKPCCIEKPLAPSFQESTTIVKAFDEANIPLFVAYYRRSLPRFDQVKKWITDGKIGDPRHIHWQLSKPPSNIDLSGVYNWRTDPNVAPGGYFDDLASHGLDLFAYLLGDFKEVSGINTNQQKLYNSSDAIAATWKHKTGTTGSGFWNFGSQYREEKVQLLGSEGTIEFSVFTEKPVVLKINEKTEELFIENPKHIQQFHVEKMRNHLLHSINHPSTGTTALHTSWVMDKILGVL